MIGNGGRATVSERASQGAAGGDVLPDAEGVGDSKTRRVVRAVVAVALVAKLAFIGLWWRDALSGPDLAVAATPAASRSAATGVVAAARDATRVDAQLSAGAAVDAKTARPRGAGTSDERAELKRLLEAIERRQAELDSREQAVASREERLLAIEADVTAKIASLEELGRGLESRAKSARAEAEASRESLAKIYAAMKPQDAAPILDQLDDATVLAIFSRMKEKQIGEILPLMSRDKAIGLTRSLATAE
jgi:flagellar motility protein MotE (MotC chaperone)